MLRLSPFSVLCSKKQTTNYLPVTSMKQSANDTFRDTGAKQKGISEKQKCP